MIFIKYLTYYFTINSKIFALARSHSKSSSALDF